MGYSKRRIVLTALGGAVLVAATAVLAQHVDHMARHDAPPQGYSSKEEQASWIADPHIREYYQATVEAFADGPDKVDRAAFERRSRAIFQELAISRGMNPGHLQAHLAAIPGQTIDNVRREPEALASFEAFVEMLFGPQSFPADAPTIGEPASRP